MVKCPELEEARQQLRRAIVPQALRTNRDFKAVLKHTHIAPKVVKWLLQTGRFSEFRLAEKYVRSENKEGAETRGGIRNRISGRP